LVASSRFREYTQQRSEHWDQVALIPLHQRNWGRSYQARLQAVYKRLSSKATRILEIGCGRGSLLAALDQPGVIGVDFSRKMLQQARNKYPEMALVQADAHALPFSNHANFRTVILSDLLNDVWDVLAVLKSVASISSRTTRVFINSYSRVWEPVLNVAAKLRLIRPNLPQNWITVDDLEHMLNITGFDVIRRWEEVLLPINLPLIGDFLNQFLIRFWPFRHFAVANMIGARKLPGKDELPDNPSVSVVIPARNEEGNIRALFERIPNLVDDMELIFVEGHSQDDTYGEIQRAIQNYPDKKTRLIQQSSVGKGNAVRDGFDEANGDIYMILDADLSVPPEELSYFFEAISSGKAEFVNGVRLVYPMESEAMRFINLVGNKFFTYAFSWLLGQKVKDTLCGTKVLWSVDYDTIAENREYFGDFDPFGDFDLLLGAAKLHLKIVDLPVRYHSRTYGQTNIHRWSHGMLLLKMAVYAAMRIKFV
jgi:ubiquinone/menaquinone biosynthesis C-methylase UbiE